MIHVFKWIFPLKLFKKKKKKDAFGIQKDMNRTWDEGHGAKSEKPNLEEALQYLK